VAGRIMRIGAAFAVLCSIARPALAQDAPDAKRKLAVIEFRAGSAALPEISQRAAALLDRLTSLDVLDQNGARATYGANLDSAIVDCAGEAVCVGKIAKQLGVDELLLVGIAEFGDVILTLQRIDADSGTVMSRVAEALAADSTTSNEALEGYLRRVLPKEDFLRYGVIRINANVEGASVSVGDKPRGVTPIQPLRVEAPATYPILVAKPGFVDFRASVAVPPDAEVLVRPQLVRKSSGGGSWYTTWWVLAIAGTVAAGAVTTAIIVSRDDADSVGVSGSF
jgi:hypothetical protein